MLYTFIALSLALVSQAAVVPSAAECMNLPDPLRSSTCPGEHRRDYYDPAGGNGDKALWDNLKGLRQIKDPPLGGNRDAEMWEAFHSYWATRTMPFVASATATATDMSVSARSFINWESVCRSWGRERFKPTCESMGYGVDDPDPQTSESLGLARRNWWDDFVGRLFPTPQEDEESD